MRSDEAIKTPRAIAGDVFVFDGESIIAACTGMEL